MASFLFKSFSRLIALATRKVPLVHYPPTLTMFPPKPSLRAHMSSASSHPPQQPERVVLTKEQAIARRKKLIDVLDSALALIDEDDFVMGTLDTRPQ